jgi:hypothetical protein
MDRQKKLPYLGTDPEQPRRHQKETDHSGENEA